MQLVTVTGQPSFGTVPLRGARETTPALACRFRVRKIVVMLTIWLSLVSGARASTLDPGVYVGSGHTLYVGIEHELPDPASNDFFDATSHHTGDLAAKQTLHLERSISEERHALKTARG